MGDNGHQVTKKCRTSSGLAPYTGTFGTEELVHLIKRTMFGAKNDDINYFRNRSLIQVVDELLHPGDFLHHPPVNDYDQIGIYETRYGETWIDAPYNGPEDDGGRIVSFKKWSIGVFINQDRSIREKMVLFWHNHFATQTEVGRSNLIWQHHSLLRGECLGNFKDLAKKITLDPHMLRYLNGENNTKLAPNENYARELQELFCIGKGSNSKYTESDVKQAARVLTGWKVDLGTNKSYFKADEHDNSDKSFSDFYKNKIIKGRSGEDAGEKELDELLDMIFANKETALFLCRKLYRWFVYSDIDDIVEKNVIRPLAEIFIGNGFEIRPVLSALFGSQHFFDKMNFGAQVKSPLDFCLGFQREFNIRSPLDGNFAVNYSLFHFLIEYCYSMGQQYAEPPNVSGWPAYYQSPGFYELWINTSTYPKRNEFTATMIDYGYNREGTFFSADVIAFARSLSDPADPDSLIDRSLQILYRLPVSPSSKTMLKKNTLLSGQSQDHYWTEAWNDYIKDPSNIGSKNIVETRLKNLYRFIVNSPEYQLT